MKSLLVARRCATGSNALVTIVAMHLLLANANSMSTALTGGDRPHRLAAGLLHGGGREGAAEPRDAGRQRSVARLRCRGGSVVRRRRGWRRRGSGRHMELMKPWQLRCF